MRERSLVQFIFRLRGVRARAGRARRARRRGGGALAGRGRWAQRRGAVGQGAAQEPGREPGWDEEDAKQEKPAGWACWEKGLGEKGGDPRKVPVMSSLLLLCSHSVIKKVSQVCDDDE